MQTRGSNQGYQLDVVEDVLVNADLVLVNRGGVAVITRCGADATIPTLKLVRRRSSE